MRELSQWIRENLMLTLCEAVFDLESAELYPEAGACSTCQMRTGANTALFEDFAQDDKCLSPECFKTKVDRHISLQKQNDAGLIQITRAYYTNSKGDEAILTRNEYTIIEAVEHPTDSSEPEPEICTRATRAIVVEGPGKRGEVLQVCADPVCEVHGRPNHKAEQEAIHRQREREWKQQQEQQRKIIEKNRCLFDAVLAKAPQSLSKADFEMLAFALIEILDYEHMAAVCERYKINTDEAMDEEAIQAELRSKAHGATERDLIRMLIELALLRSGYSTRELLPDDPLTAAGSRYGVDLRAKKAKPKGAKATQPGTKSNRKRPQSKKVEDRKAAKKGGAA